MTNQRIESTGYSTFIGCEYIWQVLKTGQISVVKTGINKEHYSPHSVIYQEYVSLDRLGDILLHNSTLLKIFAELYFLHQQPAND